MSRGVGAGSTRAALGALGGRRLELGQGPVDDLAGVVAGARRAGSAARRSAAVASVVVSRSGRAR